MSPQRSVLIIDDSSESREVFRAVLCRTGARLLETALPVEALQMAQQHMPDLIVLDVELDPTDSDDGREAIRELGKRAQANQTPLVVLATARRQMKQLPSGEFVAKPYHYGPLIRRIEELLGQ